MKKPILFGFTALCVLSTPNLIENFSHTTTKNFNRTIASQPEQRDQARPPRGPRQGDNDKFESSEHPPKRIQKEEEKEILSKEKDKDLSTVKTVVENENKEEVKEENVTLDEIVEKDVTVCEFRNEIDELKKQISELLEDKVEVVAEVDNKNKKDEKSEKKEGKEKEGKEKLAEAPSRYQQILSMGLIFGQGFQSSFQMPTMGYNMSPYMNYNPMMSFNQGNTSWMNLMGQNFSGTNQMINNSTRLGESQSFNSLAGNSSRVFIPNFNRTSIEAEGISIN